MVLKKLQLNNFKGLKIFTLEIDGSCSVYGTNASGKTTLADAMSWLLFDKASTGELAFSPKPKDENGQEIHYLETSVEGVFDSIKLKKVLKEKWTKKRGSIDQVYDGNTVDYFVNDVPTTKKEYDAAIAKECDPEIAMVLTNSNYFTERMTWQNRRELLLKVCGNLKQDDVIMSDPKLHRLPVILLGHTVEEYQIIAKQEMKRINQHLSEIPARIDEAERNISGEPDHEEYLKIKMKQASERAAKARADLANSDTDAEIKKLQLEYKEEKLRYAQEQMDQNADTMRKINDFKSAISNIDHEIDEAKWNVKSLEQELMIKSNTREKLLADYKEIKNTVWTGDTVCPTCGQTLPAEKINDAMDSFRADKSAKLMILKDKAEKECSKDILQKIRIQISEEYSKITQLTRDRDAANELYISSQASLQPSVDFEDTDVAISLNKRIEALKNGSDAFDDSALRQKISIEEHEVLVCQQKLAQIEADRNLNARIEELEHELEKYKAEADEIFEGQQLCELFVRDRVNLITDSINKRFTSVGFKLFQEQINGGQKECCEVMVPGDGSLVEYKSANNAARINAGLEIINTLSDYYGIKMPVFVDNAESVVNLVDTDLQLIKLYVSGEDKELRVE